jgi:hypothetical protein
VKCGGVGMGCERRLGQVGLRCLTGLGVVTQVRQNRVRVPGEAIGEWPVPLDFDREGEKG